MGRHLLQLRSRFRVSGHLAVQHLTLLLAFEQGLMHMLTVNIHQHIANFTQLSRGGGNAVNKRFRAPSLVNHPAQQYAAFFKCKFMLGQPRIHWATSSKLGADIGPTRPLTNHTRIATTAQGERQRIN